MHEEGLVGQIARDLARQGRERERDWFLLEVAILPRERRAEEKEIHKVLALLMTGLAL